MTNAIDMPDDAPPRRPEAQCGPRLTGDAAIVAHVRNDPRAHLAHIFPVVPPRYDAQILDILGSHGTVRAVKEVFLDPNGLANLKRITYRGEAWMGGPADGYRGARRHAKGCAGSGPVRAVVFDCDTAEEAVATKTEVRDLFGIGKFPMHINDHHAEAVEVAELYWNENSVHIANLAPASRDTTLLDAMIDRFKSHAAAHGLDPEEFCVGGSGPLGVVGLRPIQDLDLLHLAASFPPDPERVLSSHESQLVHYPLPKAVIIRDPAFHFYHRGVKFISLDVFAALKRRRREWPKDWRDVALLRLFQARRGLVNRCQRLRMHLRKRPIT